MLPVPVIGVVRTPGPLSAQFFKEFSSSVLSSGIGSYSKRSGWDAEGVTNSGLVVEAGVVLDPAPGDLGFLPVPVGFRWGGEVGAAPSKSSPSSGRNQPCIASF